MDGTGVSSGVGSGVSVAAGCGVSGSITTGSSCGGSEALAASSATRSRVQAESRRIAASVRITPAIRFEIIDWAAALTSERDCVPIGFLHSWNPFARFDRVENPET